MNLDVLQRVRAHAMKKEGGLDVLQRVRAHAMKKEGGDGAR